MLKHLSNVHMFTPDNWLKDTRSLHDITNSTSLCDWQELPTPSVASLTGLPKTPRTLRGSNPPNLYYTDRATPVSVSWQSSNVFVVNNGVWQSYFFVLNLSSCATEISYVKSSLTPSHISIAASLAVLEYLYYVVLYLLTEKKNVPYLIVKFQKWKNWT